MALRLESYDTAWPARFSREEARLAHALAGQATRIEHVGSTSVPGLLAKPIIDIAIAVASEEVANACIAPMQALGYEYRGTHGDDPTRRYYVLDANGRRVVHVHMYIMPSKSFDDMIRFRDALRVRPDLVEAYAAEKMRAADAVAWDKRAYSEAKGPFIRSALRSLADDVEQPSEALRPTPSSVARPIVGFHQDLEGHWVADLQCGHSQHVRHDPPWQQRPWVVTPEGRSRFVGQTLQCVLCASDSTVS